MSYQIPKKYERLHKGSRFVRTNNIPCSAPLPILHSVTDRTTDPITGRPKPNKRPCHCCERHSPYQGFYEQTVVLVLGEAAKKVIDEKGVEEDCEVESGEVVVEVHNTAHDE